MFLFRKCLLSSRASHLFLPVWLITISSRASRPGSSTELYARKTRERYELASVIKRDGGAPEIPYSSYFRRKAVYIISVDSSRYGEYVRRGRLYNRVLVANTYTYYPFFFPGLSTNSYSNTSTSFLIKAREGKGGGRGSPRESLVVTSRGGKPSFPYSSNKEVG